MTDFYKNLFRNAKEGDTSAPIIGHLPSWFKAQGDTKIVYDGPVGCWDLEHEVKYNIFALAEFRQNRQENLYISDRPSLVRRIRDPHLLPRDGRRRQDEKKDVEIRCL